MNWMEAFTALTAFLSMIATGLAALATYRAPILAAKVAERLRTEGEKASEQRRLRTFVFFTLMQERVTLASPQSVQSLNAIDSVFHDCGPVREAWADLYHALNRPDASSRSSVEEKQRELLRQMAVHLGLSDSLKRDDFSRIYYPTAMAEEAHLRNLRMAAEKKSLEEPRPQANVAPMFAGAGSPYPPKPTAK
jgi:hypothetical protein